MKTIIIINQADAKSYDSLQQHCNKRHLAKIISGFLLALLLSIVSIESSQAEGLADLFGSSEVNTDKGKFLKVDQAFQVKPDIQGNKISIAINITPEHYVYKDKIELQLPKGVTASALHFSQPPHSIDDPNFGKVAIFNQKQVVVTATLANTTPNTIKQDMTLLWQGCAEAGLCYPPQREMIALNLPAAPAESIENESKGSIGLEKPEILQQEDSGAPSTLQVPIQRTEQPRLSVTLPSTPFSSTQPEEDEIEEIENEDNEVPSNGGLELVLNSPQADAEMIELADSAEDIDASELEDSGNDSINEDELSLGEEPLESDLEEEQQDGINDEDMMSAADMVSDTEIMLDADITDNQNEFDDSENQNSINEGVAAQTGVLADGSALALDGVVNQDPFGLATHPWLALGLLFLAGLGLAFTPCVLPMLPIISNIIARQHNPSAKKGLLLSGGYTVGVATAYGILGAVIAIFGQSLGVIGWLQNPAILIGFAVVFVLLALYMLDVFTVPLPNSVKQKMQEVSQAGDSHLGSVFGSFIAGFLSALVISPCVSAPLFGALLAVSTIGNPWLGFAALFMLGFGLSAPLMLLGMSQGRLIPKAGAWMNWVKQGFALLLFAVALLLIARVLISPIMLMLWAAWFMVVASWAWSWNERGQIFTKAAGVLFIVWSATLLIGAAAGSKNAWQPLALFTQNNQAVNNSSQAMNQVEQENQQHVINPTASSDLHMTRLEELIPVIQQNEKVLVDVTAEWCVECRLMENTLFTNRPESLQQWQVVKLDVTEANADSERILSELSLFGPPALLYFVNGRLQAQQVGTTERVEFEETLASF